MASSTQESKSSTERKAPYIQRKCVMHLKSIPEEKAQPFTSIRWEKFKVCAHLWLNLDGEERNMAEMARDNGLLAEQDFENVSNKNEIGFHPVCYRRFTDKTRIEQAEKRCKKRAETITSQRKPTSSSSSDEPGPSPKKLRSTMKLHSASASVPAKSSSVLPEVCIICNKKDIYRTVQGKRTKEKLVQAETEDAGSLRKAAEVKRDEKILIHIRGKDCVAIEVRYHKSCYKNYTNFLTKDTKGSTEKRSGLDQKYGHAYEEFSKAIIEGRIIQNEEIIRMTKLTQIFHEYIIKLLGPQTDLPRTDRLKYRLTRDYPQLLFHTPPHRYKSEIVFICSLPAESLLDTVQMSSSTETDTDTDQGPRLLPFHDLNPVRTLYNASLLVRNNLRNHKGMDVPWPPTADMLTTDICDSFVPVDIFNFLAWCTSYSEDPSLEKFVDVPTDVHKKIISICQDIMYLASRGKNQTPKSLCLGLAIRHLTGSSQVLDLVSKLGHCASKSTIIGFETSLAELQLAAANSIPSGFSVNNPTVLVWDNIDFSEETLSGKGTTHHTNGIMVQSSISNTGITRTISLKKGRRSFKLPMENILPYHQSKRQGPEISSDVLLKTDQFYTRVLEPARTLDLAYVLSKFFTTDSAVLPGWTGFNTELQVPVSSKSSIYYLPVIEASPTEMSTVNEIFRRSLDMSRILGREVIVLVFDQAIYAKAQQIRWANDDYFKHSVVRLGEFHTSMCFLGIIGKLFKDGGLQDILIESEVTAQGSINGVLTGHHYNRSVRAHKAMFEALHRLRFRAYFDSLRTDEQNETIDLLNTLSNSYPTQEFSTIIESENFQKLVSKYESFVTDNCARNPTFMYWSMYIELVQLLLLFIRATRESDWTLHLSSIKSMLPWFFAGDRQNYSRYLPTYWLEMIQLPITHPECSDEISATGEWTVQRQSNHAFASIACDQAIEQTCNRDSKTKGGITGMTMHTGAVQRWILAQPQRAAITRQCENLAGIMANGRQRKDLDEARKKRDEEAVLSIITTIDGLHNPFEMQTEDLICISSGMVATEEIKTDILNAQMKGKMASDTFIQDRLLSKKETIFSPIKALKIKTFSNLVKIQKTKTSSGKDINVKNDRQFFARLLVIGQIRNIDLKDILTYSLGPISFPLSGCDGSLAKTDKSAMMKLLEGSVEDSLVEKTIFSQKKCAILVDAMALVQSLSNIPETFGQLSDVIFTNLVTLAKSYSCSRVDFVTDNYPAVSIKNAERLRRGQPESQRTIIYSKEQKVPKQWKKYLSLGDNKENLLTFLFTTWKEVSLQSVQDIQFYICHGQECHQIKWDPISNTTIIFLVSSLCCDHEEADTRLLLHAKHVSDSDLFEAVIINSPDTDVFVLCNAFSSFFRCNLYFLTGVKNRRRIVDVSKIANHLGKEITSALIGLHVITGCDSTSAFYGKGKKKAYQLTVKNKDFMNMFSLFGDKFDMDESLLTKLQSFVSKIYGAEGDDINEVRYKLFCASSSSEQILPPTLDALTQHCKRANYQAAVHKRSLNNLIEAPSPVGHGWEMKDGELNITWMTRKPAPDAILECLQCSCKTGCRTARCSCLASKLKCTDLCHCLNCSNIEQIDQTVSDNGANTSGSDSE